MQLFITAFSLGLLGSFHCLGMCGPIAFTLPVKNNRFLSAILYNSGRIITYSAFGLLFGVIGQGLKTATTQQFLSIAFGVLLIVGTLLPTRFLNQFKVSGYFVKAVSQLKFTLSKFIHQKGVLSLLVIGLLNGLLPCGLVYAAIGGSIATGNTTDGVLFMASFGSGTLPMMFTAIYFSNFISVKFRNKVRKILPVLLVIMGLQLIVRGLNLNIPYISPKINIEKPFIQECE
ncbi:MAG: sulfite exporter TauE/SafE family protein [Flavobacteriales bacterium]|nr:sulfite exporter TauE/SafE family protein [Flavobacteriales bacterium]